MKSVKTRGIIEYIRYEGNTKVYQVNCDGKFNPEASMEKLKSIKFSETMSDVEKSLSEHILNGKKIEDFIRGFHSDDSKGNFEILEYFVQYSEMKINQSINKISSVDAIRLKVRFSDNDVSICSVLNVEPHETIKPNFKALQTIICFSGVTTEELESKLSLNPDKNTPPENFLKLKTNDTNLKTFTSPIFV
jgi:hypothetical protein